MDVRGKDDDDDDERGEQTRLSVSLSIYLSHSLHPSIHTMSELTYFMPFKP